MNPANFSSGFNDAYGHCLALLKIHYNARYLFCLLLPRSQRELMVALYAFDYEISRIWCIVQEPMLGQIRMQWWRDLIISKQEASSSGHPVALMLLSVIERHNLSIEVFERYLDAKEFDLFNDPMPTQNDLEGYAGETSSNWLNLAIRTFSEAPDKVISNACGHFGVAEILSHHLAMLGYYASHQKLFLPGDVLAKFEVNHATVFAGEMTEELEMTILNMCDVLDTHINDAQKSVNQLPLDEARYFLNLAVFTSMAVRIRKNRRHLLSAPVLSSPLSTQFTLFRKNWVLILGSR